ncbi:MAG: hypothetical protein NW208_17605 [Bryobacter sp.]|nr:hypothetical protein [Bryobacter sp.]
MSANSENPLAAIGSLNRGRFHYFPVVPGRLEFALAVREELLRKRPAYIALELPAFFARAFHEAVRRLPEMSALVYPDRLTKDDETESAIYFVVEPCDPFVEAYRTGVEIGAEILFIDPAIGERPHLPDDYPDSYALTRIGREAYLEQYRVFPQPRNDEVQDFAANIAWKLQGADPFRDLFVVLSLNLLDPVLDAMETPQEEPVRPRPLDIVDLVNLHPSCLAEVTQEYPALQQRYEYWRKQMSDTRMVDRAVAQYETFRRAEIAYQKSTGERVESYQRLQLARYARNLAQVSGYLSPTLYEMTLAARGLVDDNYAWEVWEAGGRYDFQEDRSALETLKLSGEEVFFRTRRMKLRRRLPRPKQRLTPRPPKGRARETKPGEWAEQLDGSSICSYPPEDIVIEDFGQRLKQLAHSILTNQTQRTEPFVASLLDGIDMRETLRNWHTGEIFVKRNEQQSAEVGSVVVIFDEDHEDRYSYLTTWLGEHQNESDMAFYSTHPFAQMVGPGIGRAEYGGFLLTWPPRRVWDVWGDPDYEFATTKAERLLLAGLDYSTQRNVVYVAAKPPRNIFRSIANQLRRQILYIPIGQLSPDRLKKLRVVHVLDGYDKRDGAKEYVW